MVFQIRISNISNKKNQVFIVLFLFILFFFGINVFKLAHEILFPIHHFRFEIISFFFHVFFHVFHLDLKILFPNSKLICLLLSHRSAVSIYTNRVSLVNSVSNDCNSIIISCLSLSISWLGIWLDTVQSKRILWNIIWRAYWWSNVHSINL